MLNSNNPIGIFDSGVGGISIWKELNTLLPNENTIYLADSMHAPYGPKGKEEIIRLSKKNTKLLIERGVKIIIVACNTATTAAIDVLRSEYAIPFVGIEPAIKPAAISSRQEKVGILATEGTLKSSLFQNTSSAFRSKVDIIEKVGTGLVEAIEKGDINSTPTRQLLKKYLDPMVDQGIDKLVLGCTHYPFLKPLIKQLIPQNIEIIDSGKAVAKRTEFILNQEGMLNQSSFPIRYEFFTNSNVDVLKKFIDNDTDTSVQSLNF